MFGVTPRSLGRRLIGGRSLLSKLKSSNYNSNIYGFTSFNSFKSLHASRCMHFGAESTYYEFENKAKAGANFSLLKLQTKNAEKEEEAVEVEVKEEFTSIKKGDFVNLSHLLFTKGRDYLIKCNNGKQVKAEQLEGKVVAIYFGSVFEISRNHLTSLTNIYNDLQPNNCFEVVFVELHDVDSSFSSKIPSTPCQGDGEHFKDVFSTMPWTAIPLSDIASRIYLKQRFGLRDSLYIGSSFVVDPTGQILQCFDDTWFILPNYGAMGYPFSDERIDFLKSEDAAAIRQPSLKKLLASPERDYLISNKGDKVPIHTLEDKVVALYMYNEGISYDKTTTELKMVYEELAMNNKKFEIVLMYIHDECRSEHYTNEESFWNTFKTMPWLVLPFRDLNFKKLKRILQYPWDYHWDGRDFTLIVIGPHMEFIEPFGDYILWTFKIPAYPFSRERVAKLLTEEYKELKLEMLWDQNSAFGKKYGSQVHEFTQLAGKRVIILYGWSEGPTDFLQKLKKRYIEFKGTEEEFEVIQITYKPHRKEYFADVPWFVQPLDGYTDGVELFSCRYEYYDANPPSPYNLTAFDRDGRVVRKTEYPTLESEQFPFSAGDIEEDVVKDFDTMMESNHFCGSSYPKSICAYKRNIIEVVQQWDYMNSGRT